jgi:hypothetical protein
MVLLVILLTTLMSLTFNPYAAVLEVNYSGVSVQRIGTEEQLPLQALSIAPVAQGDNIATHNLGRATIHFSDIASVFLMPNVNITIDEFELTDDNQANLALSVDGLSIYTIHQPELLNNFSLQIDNLTIHQPASSFSVWVSDNNLISIIVDEGNLSLSDNGQIIEIPEGHGYNQRRATVTEIDFFPRNEATLFTSITQCEGLATAENNQNLTVRTFPSATGHVLGYIQDRTPVYIIGISSDQQRLRVRYYSGFGWVETTGVTYQCEGLPLYDLSNQESYYRIVNPSSQEYEVTYPYFGSTMDDPYFYVYENAPSGE